MKHKVLFANSSTEKKFEKKLLKIPKGDKIKRIVSEGDDKVFKREEIINAVEDLANNPRPFYFKKINPPVQFYKLTAQYRIRIDDHRVLYDIDEKKKTVWILALRTRSEKTYKKK
ncbi:MAG: type II toxin-antitoxin system RelE/ParE family toxin [Candidatus Pacebacteria bacterium]|nr:type II toxin-antitoxin system RelE/ParE family toxin [Candidatus Omnitrophota bacterium]MCK5590694.1 type II toxin-antitoxin system RelE/ParE family toxin [Candidatus Paceibacterota bacterium]